MFEFDENTLKYFTQKLKDYFVKSTDKVDKEEGKGLSTNDFTQEDKDKLEHDFDDVVVTHTDGVITLTFYSKGIEIKSISYECGIGNVVLISEAEGTIQVEEGNSLVIPFAFASINDGGGTLYINRVTDGVSTDTTHTIVGQGKGGVDLGIIDLGITDITMYAIDSAGTKSNTVELTINCKSATDISVIQVSIPNDNYTLILLSDDSQVVGDGQIAWGDGNTTNITGVNDSAHTFTSAGVYTIEGRFKFGGAIPSSTMKTCLVEVKRLSDQTNNLSNAFNGCSNLTTMETNLTNEIILSGINNAFYGCSSITKVDVSKFNTSQVTDMSQVFKGCRLLQQIDLNNFDTSSCTNLRDAFAECPKLISINVSNWNTSEVTNMNGIFYGCNSLTQLDISNWNTSKVTNMNGMFTNCGSLTQLDISNWNTSLVTNMGNLFSNCKLLNQIIGISNFDTSKVTNMANMFNGCSSLTQLDISNWNTSLVTNMNQMFRTCNSIQQLNLSNFDCTKVTNMINFITSSSLRDLQSPANIKTSITISANNLTHDSLINLLNNLNTVTTSQTVYIGTTNASKLTSDESKIATDKGWTIG